MTLPPPLPPVLWLEIEPVLPDDEELRLVELDRPAELEPRLDELPDERCCTFSGPADGSLEALAGTAGTKSSAAAKKTPAQLEDLRSF